MPGEYVRILSKNTFTVRTLTLLFEDAGYTMTENADTAELTVTDIPTVLGENKRGVYIYLADRGSALPKGADAVVAKPYSWDELLRTAEAVTSAKSLDGGLTLRTDTVVYKGKSAVLTKREAKLFEFFKANQSKAVTREEMLRAVWDDEAKDTNVTDVYVNYLRKKLKTAFGMDFIKSVRGIGYIYSETET